MRTRQSVTFVSRVVTVVVTIRCRQFVVSRRRCRIVIVSAVIRVS